MITDKIFISSSNTDEGKGSVEELIKGLKSVKRSYDFFENNEKNLFPTPIQKDIILNKISNCGVTILVLSSDFLLKNGFLLDKNKNGEFGWNYEELKSSLIWNKIKMHNSVIITYTDKFFYEYLKNLHSLSFPIIADNINNIDTRKASDSDSINYMEVISLKEFLKKPKYYLRAVDIRKGKQKNSGLYDLKFT